MADLSKWLTQYISIVDRYGDGGAMAFPGFKNPVPIEGGARLEFAPAFSDAHGVAKSLRPETRANVGPRANAGWRYGLLSPVGNVPARVHENLDVWTERDPARCEKYAQWAATIIANTNANTERLEAVIAFEDPTTGDVVWDQLQMFYLSAAVKDKNGILIDWVVFHVDYALGYGGAQEEGGGHGPPR